MEPVGPTYPHRRFTQGDSSYCGLGAIRTLIGAIRKGGPFLRTAPLLSRLTKVSNPGRLRDIGESDLEDFNLDVGCPGSVGGIPAKTADL